MVGRGLDTRGLPHGGGRLGAGTRRRVDQRPAVADERRQQLLFLGARQKPDGPPDAGAVDEPDREVD